MPGLIQYGDDLIPFEGPIVDRQGSISSPSRCQLCHWRMEGWTRHIRLDERCTGDVTEEWCGAGRERWWADRSRECPSRLGVGYIRIDDETHETLFRVVQDNYVHDRLLRIPTVEVLEWLGDNTPSVEVVAETDYGICDLYFNTEAEAVMFKLRWL